MVSGSRWVEHLDEDNGASQPQRQQRDDDSHPAVASAEDTGDAAQEYSPEAVVKDLIQFLRKTPPPPTNYMSIPDDTGGGRSEGDNTWDRFKTKVFRRHHGLQRRRPPPIMLPDSAVSARTIDGHRYISISIPTTHSPPLEPRPPSPYPVLDPPEAAFHGEMNARFGAWKKSPTNRLVTVLNPVAEDCRESMSSSSTPPSTAVDRPDPTAVVSGPSMRVRPHSISHLPSRERRYIPGEATALSKSKSIGGAHACHHRLSDPTAMPPQSSGEGERTSVPTPTETNAPGPSDQGATIETVPQDAGEYGAGRGKPKPTITLTLPSRTSSRRGRQQTETMSLEPADDTVAVAVGAGHHDSSSSPGTDSNGYDNGNSNGNGRDQGRGSFAASIDTACSSPRVLRAQTAIVIRPSPGLVRTNDDGSVPARRPSSSSPPPPPPPPERFAVDRAVQTWSTRGPQPRTIWGPPEPPEPEGSRGWAGRKGAKGKEPVPRPLHGFVPGMSPGTTPARRSRHSLRGEGHGPTSPSPPPPPSPSPSPSTTPSSSSSSSSSSPTNSSASATRNRPGGRGARYIARALAEERETLEGLPRGELIERYEALRARGVRDRERRLRRLESSRDAWVRAVPALLRDLNDLLREQRRLLESVGLAPVAPGTAGLPPSGHRHRRRHHNHHDHDYDHDHDHHHHHHHHHNHNHNRRRSRSVDVSPTSLSSNRGLGAPETRRSRSLRSEPRRSGGAGNP